MALLYEPDEGDMLQSSPSSMCQPVSCICARMSSSMGASRGTCARGLRTASHRSYFDGQPRHDSIRGTLVKARDRWGMWGRQRRERSLWRGEEQSDESKSDISCSLNIRREQEDSP